MYSECRKSNYINNYPSGIFKDELNKYKDLNGALAWGSFELLVRLFN